MATGRGLAALGAPARGFHDEQTADQPLPARTPERLSKLPRRIKEAAAQVQSLWAVPEGSAGTEDQMRSLFGLAEVAADPKAPAEARVGAAVALLDAARPPLKA